MHRSLEDQIPELPEDERLTELLGASVEGNVDTILRALRYDIAVERVEAPTAALEYARRLAQHGVPVNALVRAYRLGQRLMNELVFAEVRALDISEQMRYAVIETITATLFEYIDWISQQVVVAYEDERERWLENQNSIRALRVREVLAATKTIDVDAASTSIRYPLRWHHLGARHVVPGRKHGRQRTCPATTFSSRTGRSRRCGGRRALRCRRSDCGWGWLPYRASVPMRGQGPPVHPDAAGFPSVAIGTVAGGIEGFRQSHREAENAHRVALVGQAGTDGDRGDRPGLSIAALLNGDVADTRAWVAKVLGDLAGDDENDARLRETLRVYLGCGSSYKLAAEQLNLHFNSVKYRVGRAIARRGREIENDRLDVELALLICHWYGAHSFTAEMSRPAPIGAGRTGLGQRQFTPRQQRRDAGMTCGAGSWPRPVCRCRSGA